MVEQLENGDFSSLEALQATDREEAFTQLDLTRCPQCKDLNCLSLTGVEMSVDKDGDTDMDKTEIAQNLSIEAEDFERFANAWS